jgi:hypothetical protein
MRSLERRLTKLEAQRDAEREVASNVIYLDLRGEPEDRCYLDAGGPWIFLPRKAESVEEWIETVARRWRYGQEGAAS